MACELCGGTLEECYRVDCGWCRGDDDAARAACDVGHGVEEIRPCRKCLTYAAPPEVRVLALGWLGFSPWYDTHGTITGGWWVKQVRVIPLHLGAGRDLAVRVLARRLEHPIGMTAPVWREYEIDPGEWVMENAFGSPHVFTADEELFDREELGAHDHSGDASYIPALATIPEDAPADLRAGRALVLCLEATPVTP